MRRKSDFTSALDQMFCEDDKKRIPAIKSIRQIGVAIGPLRVRNQLVPFLNQFLDDDPNIMLAVLEELENFSPIIGGSEHQKILLPLLINFCLLDQKEVAMKSLGIIEQILSKHTDSYLDTVKKLAKVEMSVSKQCAVILIGNGLKKVPHLQNTLLETYKAIAYSENPSFRIIAAKNFKKITQNASNKDQICKIIQIFFNDGNEDLPKLWIIDSLLIIYSVNPNVVINKLKSLLCSNSWRINLRLCEYADEFSKYLSKIHFKALLQPTFLKMMTSQDNEIRAASCASLVALAKNMTPQQNFSKLYPIILKLSEDKVDYVKNQFAKNFVKSFPYFSQDKIKQCLIPLVVKFLKDSNLQVSSWVLGDFKQLFKHLKAEKFQQSILKPLAGQISSQNWRLSIKTLEILGTIIVQQGIYTSFIIDILLKQLKGKIQAVRTKASQVITDIIKKSPRQWSQSELLPQILKLKQERNYLIRQRVISVIKQTADQVSSSWLDNYRKAINEMLLDRIPNIRIIALKCVIENKKLFDKNTETIISKLKEDNDLEVKQIAREYRT